VKLAEIFLASFGLSIMSKMLGCGPFRGRFGSEIRPASVSFGALEVAGAVGVACPLFL
jgi:hypothetical protein